MSGDPNDEYERRYMAPGESVRFREKVVSRAAFGLSVAFAAVFGLVGLVVLGAAAFGSSRAGGGIAVGAISVAFAAFMGLSGIMFSVFRTMVTGSHVHVHFGWARRKIPMGAIHDARVVTLQGSRRGKVSIGLDGVVRTWVGNSKSGRGVELTYQIEGERKQVITIGSEDPERFVETIERSRAVGSGIAAPKVRVAEQGADYVAVEGDAAEDERRGEHGAPREGRR